MAGSVPEKSVVDPMNNLPLSVINVVMFEFGLNGHFATPLSNFVTFKLSICKIKTIKFPDFLSVFNLNYLLDAMNTVD